jgi:hypothetical protein
LSVYNIIYKIIIKKGDKNKLQRRYNYMEWTISMVPPSSCKNCLPWGTGFLHLTTQRDPLAWPGTGPVITVFIRTLILHIYFSQTIMMTKHTSNFFSITI